jgi:hypothetical protein
MAAFSHHCHSVPLYAQDNTCKPADHMAKARLIGAPIGVIG